MKKIIPSVKGTRDFYPEDMAMRTWLYSVMRQVSESFGYQEYEAPILEVLDLYAAKSGEELVKEQSFVFPDRGGDLITLRPELTPSLSRMIAQRQNQLVYPLRWWSFGPFWRYERPQKGRTREFFQWNVDLLGPDSPEADAELVALVATFFKTVNLGPQDVVILVNNRKLTEKVILDLSLPIDKKTDFSNLIDRRKKMSPEEWDRSAFELGITSAQLAALKSKLEDPELWRQSPELIRFFAAIEALGVQDYVRFDANIIRGLLYYTGTVFEAYATRGDIRRSILGGGRYDNLLSDVGGDPLPATGFAMGDVIISLLLQQLDRIPKDLSKPTAQILVAVFDADYMTDSQQLAAEFRLAGINASCYPEPARLSKQFKYADRVGITLAALIGPDERQKDSVAIKNLADGSQQIVQRSQAAQTVLALLGMHGRQSLSG